MQKYLSEMTQEESELKISLIGEVFSQIKFISEKLKPLPRELRKDILAKYRAQGKRLAFGCMFDILYIQSNQYLKSLEVSLRIHVTRKAGERRAGFTEHLAHTKR